MSSPRKKWDLHSERWKREKAKQGLTKSKWDSWFKLTKRSREITDPYQYAKGVSVATQRRQAGEQAALANMRAQFPSGRMGTMRLGVQEMTAEQLKWTAKASAAQMRRRSSVKPGQGERNPWWYN